MSSHEGKRAKTKRGVGTSSDEVGRILAEQFFAPGASVAPPPAPAEAVESERVSDDECGCGPPEDLAEAVRALPQLDALPELKVAARATPSNGLTRPSVKPAPVASETEGAGEKKRKGAVRNAAEGATEKCAKPKPEHYKVVCISMYTDDLTRLDEMVIELKKRGFSRANRSSVLRLAVEQLDLRLARKGL